MKKTIKAQVLELLDDGHIMTAMEAAHATKSKWSTTSSILYRLCQSGVADRIPNYGPLNGYGYFLRKYAKKIGKVRPVRDEYEIPFGPSDGEAREWERQRAEACGDEEERTCETCGVRMIVPGKSGTTECSKCLE